jgi:hypothetical protein
MTRGSRGTTVLVGVLVLLFLGAAATAVGALGSAWSDHRGPHPVVLASPPLEFDLPSGWVARDRIGSASDAWVREAAAKQGFTAEEYVRRTRESMLLSVLGPPAGGRYQTVDVQKGGFTVLPTHDDIRDRLTSFGFEVEDVSDLATPAGPVVLTRSHTTLGAGVVSTREVYVVSHGTGLVITVSAVGGGDVVPVTDGILGSLRTP